jgi:tetratricopeptide (TPR) repeat protein
MKSTAALLFVVTVAVLGLSQDDKIAAARDAVQQKEYQEVITLIGEPSSYEERYWLGRAQVELKQLEEADANFRQLLENDDSSSWAYEGLARVALSGKDFDEALANSAKAIERNAGNAEAHYIQGLAFAFKKDFNSAASSLEKAVELDPQHAYAHYQLGLVQYQRKRFDRTVIHFEKFIQLVPNAPEVPQVKQVLRSVKR